MKKILYIGGFCMPDGNAAAQRVLGVAKALSLLSIEVCFCGLNRDIHSPEIGVFESFDFINYPYPSSLIDWFKYLVGRDSVISEIEKFQPDAVILYNHPALAIEHITKFCHKKRIKALADVTEWYEPQGNPIFKAIKGFDTNRRMRKSHLKVDGLICISSYLAVYYRRQGAKVIEIPPLVDIEQPKWHQKVEEHHGEFRMVYAGSPGSSKDRLDLILTALDEIIPNLEKKIRFDIIGITQEQYIDTWGDNKHHDYAVFNGRRPHEEVIKKLLEADFQIFLRPDNLPNRAGFPTKFVETITSRTLPITNLSSNLKDYLINNKNGFVIEALDIVSIKSAINSALAVKSDAIEILKRNLDNTKFDYRLYSNKLYDFIKNICGIIQ